MSQARYTTIQDSQKPVSIQRRLLVNLLIGLPILWLATTAITGWRLWHEINELNDTQITQLTRYLIGISQESHFSLNESSLSASVDTNLANHVNPKDNEDTDKSSHEPRIFHLDHPALSGNMGETTSDYMGFAIWSTDGILLMADENGEKFSFLAHHQGFLEPEHISATINPFNQQWRLFYAHDEANQRVIAVGQNFKSRQEVIYKSLAVQLAPAIIGLVLFLFLVLFAIKHGFAPLNQVSETLQNRNPLDDQPLNVNVPSEIQPLVNALNQLFIKVAETLEREQRFTADASHELRSPLTALKLQADVLSQQILQSQLPESQETTLYHHIEQIRHGIERAEHLVEQLLILAKLAPEQGLKAEQLESIDWLTLSNMVLTQVNRQAREKHSQLKRDVLTDQAIFPLQGNPILLGLLLRNLLDNAIHYTPEGSTITLQLGHDYIRVIDTGHGVSETDLKRLSERFFRPAGQSEHGSGLGLSIVKRIAQLHNLTIKIANIEQQGQITGFSVTLSTT